MPVRDGITPWVIERHHLIKTLSHELFHSLKIVREHLKAGYHSRRIQFIFLVNLDQRFATITILSLSPHASTSSRTLIPSSSTKILPSFKYRNSASIVKR